ncbi:MAG TPA: response regulator transcription factor [Vicinamibacterales bacterium]|jgi:DNA-binding NarL/FixJ family response regulator|nr:response regulator transcription factor [Vicinamibacterales bacterium]
MRVLLVGPARVRDSLRAQLLDSSIDIAGEFASADEARQSGLAADALLMALEPDPQSRRRAPPEVVEEPLTPREVQVLELLAEGLANKAIADRLGISDQTVKFHVAAILGKLGVANRTEAVRVAVRRGLIAM